mgnify:CR=1 FL=1
MTLINFRTRELLFDDNRFSDINRSIFIEFCSSWAQNVGFVNMHVFVVTCDL